MPFIKNTTIQKSRSYVAQPVVLGSISIGLNFTSYMSNSGRIFTWGRNNYGQLGINSTTDKNTPVSILGAVKTFCKITNASYFHVTTIDKNGRAWAWGVNTNGELGDGTNTSRFTPVSVAGAVKTFCQISAGSSFTLAIDKDGRVWAWGLNTNGRLGDGTITSRITPVSVVGNVKTFCKINASVQNGYSLAIDKDGRVWSWGLNGNGQLGNNSTLSTRTPVSILGAVKTFCKIFSGAGSSFAIDKSGKLWSWGSNLYFVLGQNNIDAINSILTPKSIAGTNKTFCDIVSESSHTVAIDKNGRIWTWGTNLYGQLGNPSIEIEPKTSPISISHTKTFCKIYASEHYSLGLTNNGYVYSWGKNDQGQLGINSTTPVVTPTSVVGTTKTFCKLATGGLHAVAIDKNGKAWGWGYGPNGQLGENSTANRSTPVSVIGTAKTFCEISAGGYFTGAIDKNGRAWSWGNNTYGQLGDNSVTQRLTPVSVGGVVKTFCKISSSDEHTSVIDKDGLVWGWGRNGSGRIGAGAFLSTRTPRAVIGVRKTFCEIFAGVSHVLAITNSGRLWAWGDNSYGQLGNNLTSNYGSPVSVLGAVKTFCKISGGTYYSLAIDKNGIAWAWGLNDWGQLGDGTVISRMTPVSIVGSTKTFCEIVAVGEGTNFASDYHSMAIDKNGKIWAWGANSYGQRGTGINGAALTPIRVCSL